MDLPTRAERPVASAGLPAVEFGCMVPSPYIDDFRGFARIYGGARLPVRASYCAGTDG